MNEVKRQKLRAEIQKGDKVLSKLMDVDEPELDVKTVSSDYWAKIYDGLTKYLLKKGLIDPGQEDDFIIAIARYIRHHKSNGPQPQWGNP